MVSVLGDLSHVKEIESGLLVALSFATAAYFAVDAETFASAEVTFSEDETARTMNVYFVVADKPVTVAVVLLMPVTVTVFNSVLPVES